MNGRRIVVTGMGTINCLGMNVEQYWEGLKAGKSGISKVTNLDLLDSPAQVAGEVKNDQFKPEEHMDRKLTKRMDRFCQFAFAAAKMAVEDSGIIAANADKERTGVLISSGIGGFQTMYDNAVKCSTLGHKRVSPLMIPMLIGDIASGHVSIEYGFRGPNYGIVSACASSGHGIAAAFNHILLGDADVMVAGGAEATLTTLGFAGFTQAQALSTHFNDRPEKASRPFDRDRDGFVMAEGSGVLVIEDYEHAKNRGAKIYAEILSYGASGDANHITAPCPDGSGGALAVKMALKKAGLKPEDIQLVNTHGTSTPLGDAAETMGLKSVFGYHAYKIKINSTKSMIGHTLGAAAAIESIAVIKMLQSGIVHPTINLDNPDPKCDLDYVPNTAIRYQATYAISNSFGFGGHNVSLIFKKWES